MKTPRQFSKNYNPLLPGLGTADEREELNKIIETIPEEITPPVRDDAEKREIKSLRDFVL